MDFFGIGAMELLLILVLALIVVGPRQLPEVARKLAQMIRTVRRMWTDVSKDFAEELNLQDALNTDDVRALTDTVGDLRRLRSPGRLLGDLAAGSQLASPPGPPPSPAQMLFGAGKADSPATTPLSPPPSPAEVLFPEGEAADTESAPPSAAQSLPPAEALPPEAEAVEAESPTPVAAPPSRPPVDLGYELPKDKTTPAPPGPPAEAAQLYVRKPEAAEAVAETVGSVAESPGVAAAGQERMKAERPAAPSEEGGGPVKATTVKAAQSPETSPRTDVAEEEEAKSSDSDD